MSAQPPSLPPGAAPEPMTWAARVWQARSLDGRETTGAVSLSQISRAFQKGVLGPDVEVSRVGTESWENVRLVLARYASLAPDVGRRGDSDASAAPELTLTVQRDVPPRPPAPSRTELDQPAAAPPPVQAVPLVTHLLDFSFAAPIMPRIARHLFLVVVGAAALCVVAGIGAGVFSLVTRLGSEAESGSAGLGLLLLFAWAIGGAAAGAATLVLGRVAIEALLALFKIGAYVDARARDRGAE
jgi:hypothetical protein